MEETSDPRVLICEGCRQPFRPADSIFSIAPRWYWHAPQCQPPEDWTPSEGANPANPISVQQLRELAKLLNSGHTVEEMDEDLDSPDKQVDEHGRPLPLTPDLEDGPLF